jgi:hypothetical protein
MLSNMLETARFIIDDHSARSHSHRSRMGSRNRWVEMTNSASELAYDVWALAGCLGLASIGLAFELALGRGDR